MPRISYLPSASDTASNCPLAERATTTAPETSPFCAYRPVLRLTVPTSRGGPPRTLLRKASRTCSLPCSRNVLEHVPVCQPPLSPSTLLANTTYVSPAF